MSRGYIAVDLDGTLAHCDGWISPDHIGEPVPAMLDRVKAWLDLGIEVRIFTARIYPLGFIRPDDRRHLFVGANQRESEANQAAIVILKWCEKHVGRRLPVTCMKDHSMVELWDDRAIQVGCNFGQRADGRPDRDYTKFYKR